MSVDRYLVNHGQSGINPVRLDRNIRYNDSQTMRGCWASEGQAGTLSQKLLGGDAEWCCLAPNSKIMTLTINNLLLPLTSHGPV